MKKSLKLLLTGVVALGLAFPAVAAAEEVAEAPAAAAEKPVWGSNVGDKIKPITLKVYGNGEGEVDLRNLEKDTVFVVASSVCSLCRAELNEIGDNAAAFEEKGLDVMVVVVDVQPEGGAKRLLKYTKYPLLGDPEYSVGMAVDLASAPSTLVLKQDGTIAMKHAGYKKRQYKKFLE